MGSNMKRSFLSQSIAGIGIHGPLRSTWVRDIQNFNGLVRVYFWILKYVDPGPSWAKFFSSDPVGPILVCGPGPAWS